MTEIRPLAAADRDDWRRLWTQYLQFYETAVAQQVYDAAWARLMSGDPHEFSCLIAHRNGRAVGLAHYLFHRHGWKIENVCYLQDLYVDEDARGTGAGRALIEAVYAAADAAGAPSVYWLTQDFNHKAQRLYDRIGQRMPFVKYSR